MEPAGDKAATVFLSYSREDQKRALPVIKALEAAGFEVWWDGLLEGGDNFLPTTERALETADAVVVLWSKVSVDSHWVRDEAQRGRERGCLVPLSIDGTKPPLGFRQFQVIDITRWRGKPGAEEIERAIRAVRGFAGQEAAAPVPPARKLHLSRRTVFAGGAAVAAGGSLLAWWKLFPSSNASVGNSIAVQPFANQSGNKDEGYLGEGIAEEIRLTLSRNARLLVMAPTSISAATSKDKVQADLLDVAYVLSGSVRRSDSLLRITARLIEAKSGEVKWSEVFERTLDDIFAVQDSIAQAVAGAVAAQTTVAAKIAERGPGGTRNVAAYDAYLRGNSYYLLRSGEGVYRSALAEYNKAIAADRDFAAAHAARARVIVVITNVFAKASEFKAAYDDALASARKAVELAPDLASAHSTLGFVLVQGKIDLRGARPEYQKAHELGQGDADVLSLCSAFYAQTGRGAEADKAIGRALQLDPLNPGTHRMAAYVAYCARDWNGTIDRSRKSISLNPQIDQCHAFIGDALCQLGNFQAAMAEYAKEPQNLTRLTGQAIAAYRSGDAAAGQAATRRLIAELGDSSTYQQAQIAAQAGQLDQAMERLIHAREIGDVGLALAYTDPMLDPLRQRPDFSRLLSELGFG